MQKRFYKKCLLTLMIAGVATSNVFPLHPFAAEQNVKTLQESAGNYSLGPAGFQDVMAQTTSSIFAMFKSSLMKTRSFGLIESTF